MLTPILLATLGGGFGFLLTLLELKNVPKASRPSLSDPFFWLPVVVNPLFGGVLAYVYTQSGTTLTPALALNVGIAAPMIVRGMASANPLTPKTIDPGEGA